MTQKLGLISIEKATLLHLLYNPDLIPEASSKIKKTYFTTDSYSIMFEVLEYMYSNSINVTKPLVMVEIENKYKRYENEAQSLIKRVYKPATKFEECLKIIKEEYIKRMMKDNLKKAIRFIDDGDIENATNKISLSMEDYVGEEKETVAIGSDKVQSIYDEYISIYQNGYKPQGIPILYPSMQLMVESWKKGNLVIIAAETGGGKSSFAMNLAKQISIDQNHKTLYFSLEMTSKEVLAGVMACIGEFNRSRARIGKEDNLSKIEVARNRLLTSGNNLIIDERGMADINYIKKRIKQVKMKYGLDAIIVDHAGLISSDKDNIYASSDYVYNELKKLAKDLDITVFALAQFSRKSSAEKNGRPELHWLKGGSSIEQAADIAILLYNHKPEYNGQDIEFVDMCIKKNRSGGTRDLRFSWNKKTNVFKDIDELGVKWGLEPEKTLIEDEYQQQEIENVFKESK